VNDATGADDAVSAGADDRESGLPAGPDEAAAPQAETPAEPIEAAEAPSDAGQIAGPQAQPAELGEIDTPQPASEAEPAELGDAARPQVETPAHPTEAAEAPSDAAQIATSQAESPGEPADEVAAAAPAAAAPRAAGVPDTAATPDKAPTPEPATVATADTAATTHTPAEPATPDTAATPGLAAEESLTEPRASRTRATVLDPVCAAATDLARAAAVEEAGDPAAVGEHLGADAEGDRLVLHRFASLSPAYRGWIWTVVTTRAPRVRKVTVDDVVLMPGDDALLAPPWVPWSQRLRPGDVGVGDLLPTAVDDPRLALRQADVDEFVDTDAFQEQGLGRPRVLSLLGREDAAARWYAGDPGPDAHVAKVAPATCLTCGFHVRLAGALGRLFGVCANELAPDDARVTSLDHGCGAHSEALVAPSAHPEPVAFDEDPSDLEPTDVELVGAASGGAPSEPAHPGVGRPEPYGHA
jgi:hypothetical protein